MQEKIANLSNRKLDRKIVNVGYERGKRLSDYMKKNQKVLDKIVPDMVDYKNGVISKEALYSKLSRQERKVFEEYDRLYEKYYRTYIERDARAFSEGNTNKLLFGKTSDEVARLAGTNSNETSRNIVQQGNNSRNNKLWGHRLNNPSGKSYEIERIEESIDGKSTNAGRNNEASGQLPRTSKLGTRTDGSTNTRETSSRVTKDQQQAYREVFYSAKDKEVYYTGVKLSKENEALKLKMGLIEQDEAFDNKVNRLASKIFKKPVVKLSPKEKKDAANIVMAMQCTKGSETNIYYRNPSKGNGKISLTQDYSKEGKEGLLWGHKKGEMYGQKDTQRIIHSLTQDNARLNSQTSSVTNNLNNEVATLNGEIDTINKNITSTENGLTSDINLVAGRLDLTKGVNKNFENQTAPAAGMFYFHGTVGSGSSHGSVYVWNTTRNIVASGYAHYSPTLSGWLPVEKGDTITVSSSKATINAFKFYPYKTV